MRPAPILLMADELDVGGSQRQMTETARFLDRAQFDPRVGCFRPAGFYGDQLRAAGVPVLHLPVHSLKSRSALAGARQLVRYIRQEKIQLVHAFDFGMNVFALPLAKWFTPAIAVASQRFHRDLTPRGYLNLLRMTDRVADSIVVNCEFLRQHLTRDEHVLDGRIRVCHNGIDLSVFGPGEPVREPALEGASLVIGVVCVLRREKGLPALLDAFAKVRGLQPGMKLVLVGSGAMREALEKQARDLGIRNDCVFQPATNRVAEWLRAIDIFVLPSLSEALSNALMEAMACGCCAVASKVGGNPELVEQNETGLLFEAGNADDLAAALRTLIEQPALRKRLAARGTKLIQERFSIQSQVRRMGDIYSELLVRHGKASVVDTQEPQPAGSR